MGTSGQRLSRVAWERTVRASKHRQASRGGISADERNRLILEEARAALRQQREDLHKVRDRTSSLLSSGGLIAGFFGALSLRNNAGLTVWIDAAAAAVCVIALATIVIQWPRVFTFTTNAMVMLDAWPLENMDADSWTRRFAECLEENYAKNDKWIKRLTWVYVIGLVAFAAEVALFGTDLALR